MLDHVDYANAGYSDDASMGDLTDSLLDFAKGFLPGSMYNPEPLVSTAAPVVAPVIEKTPLAGALGSALAPMSAKVTAPSGLKLRSDPSETSTVLALLAQGTPVTVIKTGYPPTSAAPKGWTQVRTESGRDGFMSTEWLSISTPTSATSGNTSSSSALANLSSSGSSSSSATKPSTSLLDNKLLLVGGGVVALAVIGAIALGGSKKKAKAA